jgi:prepilin-type N-terminal cleavage/methylation domain-containing protein
MKRIENRSRRGGGFTLVELLVVIAIIAVLSTAAGLVFRNGMVKAKRSACAGNMRNIGIAMQMFAQENGGLLPETTHTVGLDQAWIYRLEEYIGEFDQTRICPADPKGKERLAAKGSSYILNSFVFVPQYDAFGNPLGKPMNRLSLIDDPERTLMCVICSDRVGVAAGNDHTHSDRWTSWAAMRNDVATDRHGGQSSDGTKGGANYLYFSGRVEFIAANEMKRKIERGENPALPPGM